MSLRPREQRELSQIEDSLHRSDPKLAVMLTAFDRLAPRGRPSRLGRRLSPWRVRLSPWRASLRHLTLAARRGGSRHVAG